MESDFYLEADVARTVAFDSNGRQLIFVRQAGFAMADASTGKILSTGHNQADLKAAAVRVSADGTKVAVLTWTKENRDSGPVQIFEAATAKFIRSIGHSVSHCELSPSGSWLFCDNSDLESTEVWDLLTGTKTQTLAGMIGPMMLSPDGRTIAFNHKGNTSIWRVKVEKMISPSTRSGTRTGQGERLK